MKTVTLATGESAMVDDADYGTVRAYKWWLLRTRSGKEYAYRPIRKEDGKYSTLLMHRFLVTPKHGQLVDHENGNGLDNQRHNLRTCTTSQNNANKTKLKGYSSEYKGVSWNKSKKKWQAFVKNNGKNTFLGYFDNEIAAAKIYDKNAVLLFGEFARPNFTENR